MAYSMNYKRNRSVHRELVRIQVDHNGAEKVTKVRKESTNHKDRGVTTVSETLKSRTPFCEDIKLRNVGRTVQL